MLINFIQESRMKPLFCLLGVFFVTIFLSFYNVSAEQESPEKAYAEALVNLTTIEPYFVGKPIYLNPDEQLKTNLRSKIVRIILNTEN